MSQWTPFPHAGEFAFDTATLPPHWDRLHRGDAEPLPGSAGVLHAWALFHSGQFQQAAQAGLQTGGAGITAANKATCIYANHLEPSEPRRLELLQEIAGRASLQATDDPANPNAWYLQAYALGRYSQGISVAKALAQGLGKRIKDALEKTITLQPRHADAHVALGTFHAEVIDKVGPLIGGMTYGARKDTGLRMFEEALRLNPGSAMTMREYARGLVMLEGRVKIPQSTRLYEQAAAATPLDAKERLDADLARAELEI